MNTSIRTTSGSDISLFYKSSQGLTGLTITATIYDIDGNSVGSDETLDEISAGLYLKKYTVPSGYEVLLIDYAIDDNIAELATDYVYVKSTLGSGSGGSKSGKLTLDKEQKRVLVKEIGEYVYEKLLPEIKKKSEFDPLSQKVITDLSGLESKIDNIEKPKDYVDNFLSLEDGILSSNLEIISNFPKIENKINEIPTPKDYTNNFSDLKFDITKEIVKNKVVIDLSPIEKQFDNLKSLNRRANNYEQIVLLEKKLSTLLGNLTAIIPSDNSGKIIDKAKASDEKIKSETNQLKSASKIVIEDVNKLVKTIEFIFGEVVKTQKSNKVLLDKVNKELPKKFDNIILFVENRINKIIREINKKDDIDIIRAINIGFEELKKELLDTEI